MHLDQDLLYAEMPLQLTGGMTSKVWLVAETVLEKEHGYALAQMEE